MSLQSIRERAVAQRNVVIYAGILVALPLLAAFGTAFDPDGTFLLMLLIAVIVPSAYNEHWPGYDRTRQAVAWVLAVAAVAAGLFTGVYIAGTGPLALSPLHASAGAFLAASLAVHVGARTLAQGAASDEAAA